MGLYGLFNRSPVTAPYGWSLQLRKLRSEATLEAIRKASQNRTPNVVLYNYPSFSGAYGALFAHIYHSRMNMPCLILPFSSVAPFSAEDLFIEGMRTCYFLGFLGPEGFATKLLRKTSCKIIAFDHRKSALARASSEENPFSDITFHVNLEKSSSTAAYEYFSCKMLEHMLANDDSTGLLCRDDQERVETALMYIEDGDLRNFSLPDIRVFNIGLLEWRSKLNCITNPFMYQELLEIRPSDLIMRGNAYISHQQSEANKLLHKVFRIRLGRGIYGECLGVRADGNSNLTDEIGKELSRRSAAAGLRPIGAIVYMQHNNLKMCLRTTDSMINTSEIAKAYGGGGSQSSSSFIIRMDEYNQWLLMQQR